MQTRQKNCGMNNKETLSKWLIVLCEMVQFFPAFLPRIASAKLALSIVLSPQLLSAPGGPALL